MSEQDGWIRQAVRLSRQQDSGLPVREQLFILHEKKKKKQCVHLVFYHHYTTT